jgi:hypothetical protein
MTLHKANGVAEKPVTLIITREIPEVVLKDVVISFRKHEVKDGPEKVGSR